MERAPAGCDTEEAKRYMGLKAGDRFETLRRRKVIKALGNDWYSYDDLDAAIEAIRRERDGGNVVFLEGTVEGESEKRRKVGSKGREPQRTAKEFLFPDRGGGAQEGR